MTNNLVDYLKRCDDAYYNTSNPIVSDSTYDALVETLRRLDPKNPYLEKVGAKVRSSKVGRVIPMGTLAKYHKDEEIQKWLESERDETTFLLSPKYDGFAVELVYSQGNLVSASTRGDGNVGEDVLAAMMRVKNVPISLEKYRNPLTIVRGEAIIPRIHHEKMKEMGYSAMRNAVPGIIRSNRAEALMYVDFVAYEFIDGFDDRNEQRDYYDGMFTVEDFRFYPRPTVEDLQIRREELRATPYIYEIDGVVLKTNTIKEDDLLHPNHLIAWKYRSGRETTVLRDIEFKVGATGAISVIGIFDPVEFQGAKLTRASFGSLALYEEMEPAIGDIIEVSRRGDIIPWIEEVVLHDPENPYMKITKCPVCGTPLEDNKCSNSQCPARVKLKLSQYIQGAKVKGLGQSLVNLLVDEGIIKSLCDIYDIDAEIIKTLPRQGDSVVKKWRTLQETKMTPLEFLCAYPIENSGKSAWESLLKKYSLSEILELTEEELLLAKVKGLGESKIRSIISQLNDSKGEMKELMIRLHL